MASAEKPAETQTSIRLASHLVRAPNDPNLKGLISDPLGGKEPGALITQKIYGYSLLINPNKPSGQVCWSGCVQCARRVNDMCWAKKEEKVMISESIE